MKIQHFMALVVLSLATVPGARAAVGAGPLTNAANGHTYYLLSHNNWTASEAEARELGGHLVTINDAAENQWVLNTFFPLTGVSEASLWIGLNDAANEGQFVWASGEPVTFTYWYPGEPNNLGGEDYATIRHPSESAPTGSWNDLSDTSGLENPNAPTFGVVELSSPPTPLPAAATQPADQFMPGSARLNGLANPSGSPTLAWFEWGTSLAYGNTTPPQSVGSGSNAVGFSNVLVGLVSGPEYHFRARASNAFGFAAGLDQTFNLSNQLPVVTSLAADQLTTNSARLRGQVNPRGSPTAAWFEWGTDTNYGNVIGMQDVGQGSSVSNLSVVLNGLTTGTNYHYRLVATNAFGAGYGANQTFKPAQRPPTTITWTGADPSGYWSASANWSPTGVPVNGDALVFPGGLPPGDMVSTNDLTDRVFRSITFSGASRHTIRGNPMTLTNRTDCIINSGTNVIACDLTFSGTPSPTTIRSSSFSSGELTVIGNVGGGSLYMGLGFWRLVIMGQFTGGSLFMDWYTTLALYGDNPYAVSVTNVAGTLLVQGSQPNLNMSLYYNLEDPSYRASLSGDGAVGDVADFGFSRITPDSTLSVKNINGGNLLIRLNGTNVGEYGRLVASGNVRLGQGSLLPSPGFNPQPGQVFTIVDKISPGPITGPITNAPFGPEGKITTLNGMPFRISYVGGDGNDVTLTAEATNLVFVPIPIPGLSGISVAWGDYDNDGRLDFLFTGYVG
ncbi:MAG TPA: C-type lectin domain-containing protein, partial [Candidatus Dormibacteraeota bacterium]|nr:C-type lectin domain-containing protein [Candidatus Dormibacteraeota bacterium]